MRAMPTTLQEPQHSLDERLEELRREEAELERRTDGYQWNHAVALVLSILAVFVAFAALAVALTRNQGATQGVGHMSMPAAAAAPGSAIVATGSSAAAGLPVKRIAMTVK